jgi:phage baseplate assembly protein V
MHAGDTQDGAIDELIRFGTIAGVDLAQGTCSVDTGDVQTADVRWLETRAGSTRTWSPPTVGEQVVLLCPGGDIAGAVALRGVHQDAYPPAGNSLRELIQFEDGAVIAYDPEAHLLDVALPGGATINILAAGGVTIDASNGGVSITGDLTVQGKVTASDEVEAAGIKLTKHKHLGVQAGGAKTGLPE